MEGLALNARQREDREIDDGDDDDAENARPDHLSTCRGHEPKALVAAQQASRFMLCFAKAPQAVFDDDDRAIDDQAEVERAKTHQVCRHPGLHHPSERNEHRHRDHSGGDQRRADVAEKQEQHDDHEKRTFEEIFLNGADGPIDELGAIIEGMRDDPGGQRPGRLFEAFGGGFRDDARVLTSQHEDGAEHDLLAVLRRRAGAQSRPDNDIRDIGDPDRYTAARGDDDLRQVVGVGRLTRHTNEDLFTAALDIARAGIGVVAFERFDHVGHRQFERRQSVGVRRHMILLGIAADSVDLGNARDGPHLRADHPVMQRAQFGRRPGRAIGLAGTGFGFDRIHEDFTEPGGDWPHLRFDTRRQLRLGRLNAFVDELAREKDIGAVLEHYGDLAEPVSRDRTGIVEPRQSGDGGLDRKGNALLGLQRGEAFRFGVDLYLDVGDVGHSVDREFGRAPKPERAEQRDGAEHKPALPDREADDAGEHVSIPPDQWSWLAPDFSMSARTRKAPLAA